MPSPKERAAQRVSERAQVAAARAGTRCAGLSLDELWEWKDKKIPCRVREESGDPAVDDIREQLNGLASRVAHAAESAEAAGGGRKKKKQSAKATFGPAAGGGAGDGGTGTGGANKLATSRAIRGALQVARECEATSAVRAEAMCATTASLVHVLAADEARRGHDDKSRQKKNINKRHVAMPAMPPSNLLRAIQLSKLSGSLDGSAAEASSTAAAASGGGAEQSTLLKRRKQQAAARRKKAVAAQQQQDGIAVLTGLTGGDGLLDGATDGGAGELGAADTDGALSVSFASSADDGLGSSVLDPTRRREPKRGRTTMLIAESRQSPGGSGAGVSGDDGSGSRPGTSGSTRSLNGDGTATDAANAGDGGAGGAPAAGTRASVLKPYRGDTFGTAGDYQGGMVYLSRLPCTELRAIMLASQEERKLAEEAEAAALLEASAAREADAKHAAPGRPNHRSSRDRERASTECAGQSKLDRAPSIVEMTSNKAQASNRRRSSMTQLVNASLNNTAKEARASRDAEVANGGGATDGYAAHEAAQEFMRAREAKLHCARSLAGWSARAVNEARLAREGAVAAAIALAKEDDVAIRRCVAATLREMSQRAQLVPQLLAQNAIGAIADLAMKELGAANGAGGAAGSVSADGELRAQQQAALAAANKRASSSSKDDLYDDDGNFAIGRRRSTTCSSGTSPPGSAGLSSPSAGASFRAPRPPPTLRDCAIAVVTLTRLDAIEGKLVEEGAVLLLLTLMNTHAALAPLCVRGLYNLACVDQPYPFVERTIKAFVMLAYNTSSQAAAASPAVRRTCAQALCHLADLKAVRTRMVEEGVVQALTTLCRTQPGGLTDNDVLVRRACASTLEQLTSTAICAVDLLSKGAVSLLVSLASDFDEVTLQHAAHALARLAAAASAAAVEEQNLSERFANEGGVDALAHICMRALVYQRAASKLAAASGSGDGDGLPPALCKTSPLAPIDAAALSPLARSTGGHDAMAAEAAEAAAAATALTSSTTTLSIATLGAVALRCLARNAAGRHALIKDGAVVAIASLLRGATDAATLKHALVALAQLLAHTRENTAAVLEGGAVLALVELLRLAMRDGGAQTYTAADDASMRGAGKRIRKQKELAERDNAHRSTVVARIRDDHGAKLGSHFTPGASDSPPPTSGLARVPSFSAAPVLPAEFSAAATAADDNAEDIADADEPEDDVEPAEQFARTRGWISSARQTDERGIAILSATDTAARLVAVEILELGALVLLHLSASEVLVFCVLCFVPRLCSCVFLN